MNDLLLLETGGTDNLLMETADNLLLESSGAPAGAGPPPQRQRRQPPIATLEPTFEYSW